MDAMNAMLSGEEVILVTNPEISCLTDTMKVGIVLRKAGLAVLGFVLNRYGISENDIPPDVAEEVMEIRLLAVIPEDPHVREATLEGVPLWPISRFSGRKSIHGARRKDIEDSRPQGDGDGMILIFVGTAGSGKTTLTGEFGKYLEETVIPLATSTSIRARRSYPTSQTWTLGGFNRLGASKKGLRPKRSHSGKLTSC